MRLTWKIQLFITQVNTPFVTKCTFKCISVMYMEVKVTLKSLENK